jgi:hypothetical protein
MELKQVAVKKCNKPVNRLLYFIMSLESSGHAADRQTKSLSAGKKEHSRYAGLIVVIIEYSNRLNLPLLQTATNFGFG